MIFSIYISKIYFNPINLLLSIIFLLLISKVSAIIQKVEIYIKDIDDQIKLYDFSMNIITSLFIINIIVTIFL